MMATRHILLAIALCLGPAVMGLSIDDNGSQIVDAQGNVVKLKGFNWFGFNNGGTMLDGLWGANQITSDFATVVQRQKMLGFNAVRLPFSFKDLALPPRSFLVEYCTPATPQEIAAATVPPGVTPPGPAPPLPSPPQGRQPGKCNEYLPNTSTEDRFIYVAKFFADNGFYVLVDNHLREDQTAISDPAGWATKWAALAVKLAADPVLKEHLILDILNEPDNYGLRWEPSGGKPGMQDLYISAMDKIEAAVPGMLFAIEGTGQGNYGANWGDGTATDPAVIQKYGISDPNIFFKALMGKPYRSRVVLAPHVYPPSVTNNQNNAAGAGLYFRLSTSFGYLMTDGYCINTDCQRFPVAIGEFGSRFVEAGDLVMLEDFASYLNYEGAAADGNHEPIDNWYYWSWNANSGDTGGIVDDTWKNILWNKIAYMQTIGLVPWYATGGVVPPTLPPAPAPTPTPTEPTPPEPVVPTPPPETAPPETTPPPAPVPVPPPVTLPPPGEYSCAVAVDVAGPWQDGSGYATSINFYVSTVAGDVAAPWELTVVNSAYTSVSQSWNWAAGIGEGSVSGWAVEEWQTLRAGAGPIGVGMVVVGSSQNLAPTEVKLNGETCTITVNGPPQASTPPPSGPTPPSEGPTPPPAEGPTPPPPPPEGSTPPPPPPAGPGGCQVRSVASGPWQDGSNYATVVNFFVSSSDNVAAPWILSASNPTWTGVTQSWNFGAAAEGSTVSGSVSADWQALGSGRGDVNVGMVVVGSEENLSPTEVSVNGVPCELFVEA